jgi:hypothetical protein
MHNAPAVSFPVGRSRFQGGLIATLASAGFFTVLVWAWQSDVLGWLQGVGLGLWVASFVWAAWQWWRTPEGSLSWDGMVWTWASFGSSVVVLPSVHLDLQRAMLLRLRTEEGLTSWVWIERTRHPVRWMAIRRAIHARVRPVDGSSAEADTQPTRTAESHS